MVGVLVSIADAIAADYGRPASEVDVGALPTSADAGKTFADAASESR